MNETKTKKIKSKGKKEIIIWEGFRRELPWILLWALLGIMVYGYYQDKQICDEVLANPCEACYKLNQTLMDSDYLLRPGETRTIPKFSLYINVSINESIIPLKDKNPNDRTISSYE